MGFSYTQQKFSPEESSPMNGLVSRAMKGYSEAQKLKYQPRMMEAEILAKNLGPLAELGTSTHGAAFAGEQGKEAREAVSQLLHDWRKGQLPPEHHGLLHRLFGEHENKLKPAEHTTPAYASDENLYNRLAKGADALYGTGNKTDLMKSNLASASKSLGLPDAISNALGGTKTNSANAANEQAINEGVQRLKMKGYDEANARSLLQRQPNEDNNSYKARIKSLFISEEKQPNENEITSETNDEAAKSFSEQLSDTINKNKNIDIPPTFIFDWIQKHPDNFHINDLIKAYGVKNG